MEEAGQAIMNNGDKNGKEIIEVVNISVMAKIKIVKGARLDNVQNKVLSIRGII